MIDVPVEPLKLHAGPDGITIDTTRLGEEALGMVLVLLFFILLRVANKIVGRL